MGMVKVKSITLEDGKLIKSGRIWVYTGDRGTFSGSKAREALAKAYGVDASDVEVKILRFRDGTIKALVCIEGLCELYDVECEEGEEGGGCG
jgi:ribosomal protein S24E